MKNVLKLKDSNKPAESKQEDDVLELYMDYVGDDGYVYKHNGREYYRTNISLQGPKGNPGPKGRDGLTPNIGQNGNWYIGGKDTQVKAKGSGEIKKITYSELKNLRDNSNLSPGCHYRITDYQCTTTQEGTQSAGHHFDIIVHADDPRTLNENAFAIEHEGDTYFQNANLSAWELKYCLDNDTNRFAWADPTNGKGVIYYMKDEWDNECPYDFKNIMFLRGQDWRDEHQHQDISQNIFGNCEEEWFYTFSCYEPDDLQLGDASLKNCDGIIYDTEECSCFGNIIKTKKGINGIGQDSGNLLIYLNNIVFFNTYNVADSEYYSCFSNIFSNDCNDNTFGSDCYSNTFGHGCKNNTFEGNCGGNIFGNHCSNNTFGSNCQDNTFGNSFQGNVFGNTCCGNKFENFCTHNTFGNSCTNNTFGNRCTNNTFGNRCNSNTFGNNCEHNTLQSYFENIIFENGNRYINLTCYQTTSSSNKCRNVLVALGVHSTSPAKTITINARNQTNRTVVRAAADTEITV